MQELEPVPGMAGRLFGAGAAANGGSSATEQHGAAEERCPRCGSPNTKFCYYNNYNLAQPRHFCKACRRYWTKGGNLRNVPVGGGCRKHKPKRPAAADGSDRNGKIPRSGCAGAGASSSPAADGDAPVSSAFSAVAEPSSISSGPSSSVEEVGAGRCAAGDMRRTLLVPPPAPVFADQAAVFASLFATPRPLPGFSSSAHPMAEERAASSLAEQRSPESDAAAAAGTAPFSGSARPDGALAAGAGVFELAGAIAGDASLPEYWNPGSWTDPYPDPTIYLP
ncbi:hypothetical protein PVAP13_4KG127600 [Panicum virgatum]|uniref:Dof zinc finger protein n=2 Tax=Panicum virgatum TaxID=38727 RepID=A0A8T0TQJ6_PANVG|nr:hypothetical protein PVAP13_4KG127600 [Panicum virgatum]